MKKSGSVWLNTAVETLKNRLLNERMSRPLIREIGDELQRYIVRKLSERRMYYEQADVMVNGKRHPGTTDPIIIETNIFSMNRNFLSIAALLGALSVVLGAFAAHKLKEIVSPDAVAVFETGVRYQFYHVFALLLWPASEKFSNKWMIWAEIVSSQDIYSPAPLPPHRAEAADSLHLNSWASSRPSADCSSSRAGSSLDRGDGEEGIAPYNARKKVVFVPPCASMANSPSMEASSSSYCSAHCRISAASPY